MKHFFISLVILFSVLTAGNTRTENMVTVTYAGSVIEKYYREDYIAMMIFLRWSREISKAEQNNAVHLLVGPDGCKVVWQDQSGQTIKSIDFNKIGGEFSE
jgi:hypothetical protein